MAEEKELYVVSAQLQALSEKLEGMQRTAAGCCDMLDQKAAELESFLQAGVELLCRSISGGKQSAAEKKWKVCMTMQKDFRK